MELELEQAPEEIIPPHDPVFVGEVRLSDFKDILTQHGFRVRSLPSLPSPNVAVWCGVWCIDHHLYGHSCHTD
jgi:hypothetical protein